MDEVVKFLNENSNGYLATVEDGEPRVRPWAFMFAEDGKLFFCTSKEKDVYSQLKDNPMVEYASLSDDNYKWARIRGELKLNDDLRLKEKVMQVAPRLKDVYKSPENPVFVVLYMEHGEASITSFGMKEPRVYNF